MNRWTSCIFFSLVAAATVLTGFSSAAPIYNITPLVPSGSDHESYGTGISPSGAYVTGSKATTNGKTGLLRTQADGTVELPELSGDSHPYVEPSAVNNHGVIVGTAYTTGFRSGGLPLIWENTGTVAQLPLPTGLGVGIANSINDNGLAVGAVGTEERAATFTTTEATILSKTLPDGGILTAALDVNNGGQIVGTASNPNGDAATRAFSLTPGSPYATDLGTLAGDDTAMAFGVSENGYVVGESSMLGEGGTPFIWSVTSGMAEIPTNGYQNGTAMAVNSDGWVVGDLTGMTTVPFLYDGHQTYLLHDLIPTASGWNLSEGLSNAARGISEDGTITGRGLYNGERTGFVMPLVPEPNSAVLLIGSLLSYLWIRRR